MTSTIGGGARAPARSDADRCEELARTARVDQQSLLYAKEAALAPGRRLTQELTAPNLTTWARAAKAMQVEGCASGAELLDGQAQKHAQENSHWLERPLPESGDASKETHEAWRFAADRYGSAKASLEADERKRAADEAQLMAGEDREAAERRIAGREEGVRYREREVAQREQGVLDDARFLDSATARLQAGRDTLARERHEFAQSVGAKERELAARAVELPACQDELATVRAQLDVEKERVVELRRAQEQQLDDFAAERSQAVRLHAAEDANRTAEVGAANERRAREATTQVEAANGRAEAANGRPEAAAVRAAECEAELAKFRGRAAAGGVVALLVTLAFGITLVWSETGFGKPDRGRGFRDNSTRLQDGAAGALGDGRPAYWDWSGVPADRYDGHVQGQQARLAALVAADLRVADVVAGQEDHIEVGRQTLVATLGGLAAGIAVAAILEGAWRTAVAFCQVTASALERTLVSVGICVAAAAVAAAVGVLIALDEEGKATERALASVTDIYLGIVRDVAVRLPQSYPLRSAFASVR